MAINEVTATVGDESGVLYAQESGGTYSGEISAPMESGNYAVSIAAYDDAGNVSVASGGVLEVTLWSAPKVDWKPTDRFNYWDYNRIKNNLQWLHEEAMRLYKKEFDIVDMGESITDFKSYWEVMFFNAWEDNLEIINQHIVVRDYGLKKVFYENGPFIQWDELNRIEGATLEMRGILDAIQAGLRRLSFRLGSPKGVRT